VTIKPIVSHPWDVSPQQAKEIQRELRRYWTRSPLEDPPHIVAGLDVSVKDGLARSAVVLLSFPELEPLEAASAERPATFPYVPGLLAFREGPVLLEALEKLTEEPDVLIFDAHGFAHPRRIGLATHLGTVLDIPAVGCAKSCLCGDYEEPDGKRGSWTRLWDDNEAIGAVVRTRDNVRPVFVSIGHRTDLETAVALVLECAPNYRLPETTRWAHRVAAGAPFLTPTSGQESISYE
jgi:deoxyribonuclease V